MKDKLITVVTPTYNRAHTLRRVYDSLIRQESTAFEWLVIDDGSSDNTADIIKSFADEGKIPIRYYFKENGGRHTALNMSYELIETEWVINIDSDDELADNAISLILNNISKIPTSRKDKIWAISGRCIDSRTREMIGQRYPDDINKCGGVRQRKLISKCKGEKSICRRLNVLKEYPFPVYKDIKFVGESTIWEQINDKYDQWCTNDIFRVYYQDSPDSLAKGKTHSESKRKAGFQNQLTLLNKCRKSLFINNEYLWTLLNLIRYATILDLGVRGSCQNLKKFIDRFLVAVLYYPMSVVVKIIGQK